MKQTIAGGVAVYVERIGSTDPGQHFHRFEEQTDGTPWQEKGAIESLRKRINRMFANEPIKETWVRYELNEEPIE